MKKKVILVEIKKDEREYFRKSLKKDFALAFMEEALSEENLEKFKEEIKDAEILSTFVYSKITEKVLEAMPELKLITTRSTGYDHIDVENCKKRNILVSNVPVYGENTVAEHTFALILSLSRKIHKAYFSTFREKIDPGGLRGFDLKDKTLGVVGAGHIGLHVIRMARGFGMEVLAFDITRQPFLAEILNFRYVTLEHLLKHSDVISLHAPLNEHTHHLINKENIKLIKKGALIINTARGELLDTEALLLALNEGIVSGAGLDVLEGEVLIHEEQRMYSPELTQETLQTVVRNHILLHRDDVVITPHIGFYSKEAIQRIRRTTVKNIRGYLRGSPRYLVG
ncbi:MAG: hydroxyacid dehydrogenase [Firmicutes bacterium HGW-Firmicutes-13]|nr:MAG: hydroxyacid dehydrogenase [Firmicutes bacterium HGW-Firmicutes-13]